MAMGICGYYLSSTQKWIESSTCAVANADTEFTLCRFKEEAKKCDLVRRTARARLPTEYGEFQVFSYESTDGLEHAALVEVCPFECDCTELFAPRSLPLHQSQK